MSYVFGADEPPAGQSRADCVNACQTTKSEAYRACQQRPAGSAERETCFRQADADLDACLKVCGAPGLWGSVALIGVGLLLYRALS